MMIFPFKFNSAPTIPFKSNYFNLALVIPMALEIPMALVTKLHDSAESFWSRSHHFVCPCIAMVPMLTPSSKLSLLNLFSVCLPAGEEPGMPVCTMTQLKCMGTTRCLEKSFLKAEEPWRRKLGARPPQGSTMRHQAGT